MSEQEKRARGRPPGPSANKVIKEKLKSYSEEAIDNLVDVMRFNRRRVDELLSEYANNRVLLDAAKKEGDTDLIKQYEDREKEIFNGMKGFNETTARYSVKMLDYSYNLILNEDRLSVSKQKIRNERRRIKMEEEDDDSSSSFSAPVVSLKPVGSK